MKNLLLIPVLFLVLFCSNAQQTAVLKDKRDGQEYKIVKIGDQWWMAQNLNYYTETGSMGYEDSNVKNTELFGRLYEWGTAIKCCPDGWHIPTYEEWRKMEMTLGLKKNEPMKANNMYGIDEGGKLKETGTTSWLSPNSGATNSSGFTALPGGHFFGNKLWGIGKVAHFWARDKATDGNPWYRSLKYNSSGIHIYSQIGGYKSVRCVKD